MNRRVLHGAAVVVAIAAAACGATNRDPNEQQAEIEVTGCLTSSGDRFVLTTLERAETGTTAAAPATESYLLKGNADEFRANVNKEVRVSGMADVPAVAIARQSSPPAPAGPPEAAGTGGQQGAANPQVKTEEQTRIEVAELNVREMSVTADRCAP
jgi:hypothetical protein